MEDVGAFNGIMVFHEFLRNGRDAMVDMLIKLRGAFPERYLFMGEFDRISDDEFAQMERQRRIHPLFYQEVIHGPKQQGELLRKDEWLEVFQRAGVRVLDVADHFSFRLVEYVLQF